MWHLRSQLDAGRTNLRQSRPAVARVCKRTPGCSESGRKPRRLHPPSGYSCLEEPSDPTTRGWVAGTLAVATAPTISGRGRPPMGQYPTRSKKSQTALEGVSGPTHGCSGQRAWPRPTSRPGHNSKSRASTPSTEMCLDGGVAPQGCAPGMNSMHSGGVSPRAPYIWAGVCSPNRRRHSLIEEQCIATHRINEANIHSCLPLLSSPPLSSPLISPPLLSSTPPSPPPLPRVGNPTPIRPSCPVHIAINLTNHVPYQH